MTNMTVPPVTEQYDYISELGAAYNHALDTDSSDKKFVLNTQNNPKPEFTRLVVHHYGCVGGDSFWNSHWTQCFGEKYPYGRRYSSDDETDAENSENIPASTKVSETTSVLCSVSDELSEGISLNSPCSSASGLSPAVPGNPRVLSRLCKAERFRNTNAHMKRIYGTNYGEICAWQKLCEDCGIVPAPTSIRGCRKALDTKYINIFDFVEDHIHPFPSYKEFIEYTVGQGKIYPLEAAKEDVFIRALLHNVPVRSCKAYLRKSSIV